MTILILACGKQDRFTYNNYGIKQLLMVHGESLIDRMVRLSQPYQKPVIVSWKPELKRPEADYFTPVNCAYVLDTLNDCADLWTERTIVLLGDVYYTDDCFKQIMEFTGDIGFFSDLNDIFAISFSNKFDMKQAIKDTFEMFLNKVPVIRFRNLWISLGSGWGNLHLIYDETQDFDIDNEYEDFLNGISKNRLFNLINKK